MPAYSSIGAWAPLLLLIARLFQGLSVGGEYGTTATYMSEVALRGQRGFFSSFQYVTLIGGQLLAVLVVVLLQQLLSQDELKAWGWRIPFALSIVMVAIGLYIRLGILETPTFQRLLAEERIERVPVVEVMKRQPRQVILAACLRMAEQGPAYIYLAFVFAYGTQVLHAPRDFLLKALIVAGLVSFITIPLSGHVSDLIGRKRMYLIRFGRNRHFRVHLLRHAEYRGAGLDLSRYRAVVRAARHDVRTTGRPDRGVLHATLAL